MYHIKEDKRSKSTAAFVYQAFRTLLEEKHVTDITISEVIHQAEISRATFYRNFDALEDVLRYELDQKFIQLFIHLTTYFKSTQDTTIHPLTLLKPFLQFWYNDSTILEEIFLINHADMIMEKIREMMKLLLQRTTMNADHDAFFDYMLSIRANIIFSVLQTWIDNQKNMAPEQLYARTIAHLNESWNMRINIDYKG